MKQILFITSILFFALSCKSQVVTIDSDDPFIPNSGIYYKDLNDDFNSFQGEWKWENNLTNSSLEFVINKIQSLDSGQNFTYDLLIAEYKYVESGIQLANTLSAINDPSIIGEYHKISGYEIITKYAKPECPECSENEKRLRLIIEHDNYEGVYGWLVLRHFTENNTEKIKVIVYDGPWLPDDQNAPQDIDIPFGEYIMVKQ